MPNIYDFTGVSSSNYIKQVTAESVNYDIALTNGIKFLAGNSDTSGATWDGTQAITITIPTLTDLVQDPIRFAGTVGSDGIAKTSGGQTFTPAKGDLVYITANCTFAGEVCEAGDMAVYDGSAWRIIQGENQVSIVAAAASGIAPVSLTGTLQDVLEVEGTTLKLAIDYADVYAKVKAAKNTDVTVNLSNATVAVSAMRIDLSQGSDSALDIIKSESIDLPTALADGSVTISDKVLAAGDFTFTSGAFPTISKNAAAINVSTSHAMSIGKTYDTDGANGVYLTDVVAIKGASLQEATSSDAQITYMSGLVAAEGKSFVSGIHAWTNADGETVADFTIPGAPTVNASNNTFISGLGSASDSGDLVSSITVGTVSISTGSGILTGTSSDDLDFIKSVTFGNAVQDTAAEWFYSGLGSEAASGDVVTSVSVGAVSIISDANSALKANAIVSASVSGHVLSFNTGAFMTPIALSKAADDIKFKSFTKTGVKLFGFSYVSDSFTTGSISQAATEISYRSLLSKAVELTAGTAISYYLDKDTEHNYTAGVKYAKISTVNAEVSRNTPKLENTTITATIAANTVAVDLNAGTLPSLTIGSATGTISGSVSTALSTSTVSWNGVDATKAAAVSIPGAYSLVSVSEGGVAVAAADDYSVANGEVTIPANTFVTDVYVNGSIVGVPAGA